MSRSRALRDLLQLARDPNWSQRLGDIALLKMAIAGTRESSEHRAALAKVAGYHPQIDLDALLRLPSHTFGYHYAAWMRDNQLEPFRFSAELRPEVLENSVYGLRVATTHDMIHVLLGFGPDWVGELGVLAFSAGQRWSPWIWPQVVLAWPLYWLRSGFALSALRAAWTRGYTLGQRAPLLLAERLGERFDADLATLRAELHLEPSDA